MKTKSIFAVVVLAAVLAGCASSAVVVGQVRPAISPTQVKLYLNPPKKFEQVALLESSSKSSWAVSDQGKTDVVIQRLKEEAAKIGANGILLSGMGNQSAGSVGTANLNGNTAFGVSAGIFHKSGNGMAIYVTEE
jgi:opacity protein-like surface antigen